ncbi:No apical meristem (NAM) protein [Corchorus olitorius]|uniref:No apical meristem (NAM) protein n=1 Tax=Corchorus olitorius TaxID=93759 RepID=A0A1R3K6B4_9ROSI|nr:No apical meristem (NAM) protein [Corchorus olitorius]
MEEASSSRPPFVPKKDKINVPIGFRFKARDDELVVYYLKPKAYNQPLPPNIIEDVELYSYSPEALTAEDPNGDRKGETEWFFFTPRNRKYRNGSRPDRGAGDGYWKATGADKKVRHQGKIEGFRKTLVYYRGSPKPPGGKKTNWIMHEYVLKDPPPRQRAGIDDMKLDNCVLCKVYKKKQGKKQDGETLEEGTTGDEDEGEGDGGEEEGEEQQFSNTIEASPQISVNQNQQHQNGGSEIMNQPQIAVDQQQNHENGGSNIMNPSQLIHQPYNNMMLPQATYPPMLPYYSNGYNAAAAPSQLIHQPYNNMMLPQATYPPMLPYYSNGYNAAAASASGFSDLPECFGLGQDLPCYGNFAPTAAPILPPQFPSLPEIYGFTDDERNFWESQDFNFEQNGDKNETKTKKRL